MIKLIAVSGIVALAATNLYYLRLIQNAVKLAPHHQIISSATIPDDLEHSAAAKAVNPNAHVSIHDTRYVSLEIPAKLSDEEVLARFVKGFFGGYVFGPERAILQAVRKDITQFDGMYCGP